MQLDDTTPNTPDSSVQERISDKPVNSVVKGAAYGVRIPRDPAAKMHPSVTARARGTAPRRMTKGFRK